MSNDDNPCMDCGACCAYFRVSFYWGEYLGSEGSRGNGDSIIVPEDFTEPLSPFLCCMKGTNQRQPRCQALSGQVGKSVRCTIYASRPSPCREFNRAGEQGQPNDACDRARAQYNLPPLSKCKPGAIIATQTDRQAASGCPEND
ncbi:YkgJ family cysteine cluster protein [Acerihabitans sp. TG2]|uniref:YkgJ family cysteine cluster protein n=1 Tax=Acerihabitans sp. TG2 TaxID=3096008 RepID=UPI002B234A14|nr:YkgJ family cysteine cluster protein [Acerihabitans sp. TG2]MEA9389441.1 YkgJ family cysteine cluster protein [Acerihabitans sp. TG2]